jgi:hypothetical protein
MSVSVGESNHVGIADLRRKANSHPGIHSGGSRTGGQARPKDVPRWNFHNTSLAARAISPKVFAKTVEPLDTRIKAAIAPALAKNLRRCFRLKLTFKGQFRTLLSKPLPWRRRSN